MITQQKNDRAGGAGATAARAPNGAAAGAAHQRWPRIAIAVSLILLALVGGVDAWSGTKMTFGPFYLVPIVLATWFASPTAGMLVCIAAVAIRFGIEIRG